MSLNAVDALLTGQFSDGLGDLILDESLDGFGGGDLPVHKSGDGLEVILGDVQGNLDFHLDSSSSGSAHGSETSMNVPMMSFTSAVIERRCFLATLTRASYRSRSMRTGRAALGTLAPSAVAEAIAGLGVAALADRAAVRVLESSAVARDMPTDAVLPGVVNLDVAAMASRAGNHGWHFVSPWFANAKVAPCYQAVNSIDMKRCPECGSVLVSRRCPRCDRWRVR